MIAFSDIFLEVAILKKKQHGENKYVESYIDIILKNILSNYIFAVS